MKTALQHLEAFENETDAYKRIGHAVAYADAMIEVAKPHFHRVMVAIAAEHQENNCKVLCDLSVDKDGNISVVTPS